METQGHCLATEYLVFSYYVHLLQHEEVSLIDEKLEDEEYDAVYLFAVYRHLALSNLIREVFSDGQLERKGEETAELIVLRGVSTEEVYVLNQEGSEYLDHEVDEDVGVDRHDVCFGLGSGYPDGLVTLVYHLYVVQHSVYVDHGQATQDAIRYVHVGRRHVAQCFGLRVVYDIGSEG